MARERSMLQRRASRWLRAAAAVVLVGGLAACAGGNSNDLGDGEFDAEDFFRGQTIDVVVNASPSGGIDTWPRLIMAKLGEHVPGNPRFRVSNQTGIGGLSTVFDAPEGDLVLGTASKGSRLYA